MTNDPLGTFRNQLIHGVGELSARRRRARTVAAATVVVAAIVSVWLVGARQDNGEVVVTDGPSSATSPDTPPGPKDGSNPDDAVCDVTRPTGPGLTVPDGWPRRPSSGIWYGTTDLWTALPVDGSSPTPRKSVWWSAKFQGGSVEPRPDIAVTWERLDKPAALLRAGSPGTNAASAQDGSFMIAGIDPPSAGCWKVTASYRGTTVSYVYWNPSPSPAPPPAYRIGPHTTVVLEALPSTTTVVVPTPSGPPPDEPDVARMLVEETYQDAFDASKTQEQRTAAVQDGPELAAAGAAAAAKYPEAAASITIKVYEVIFLDPTTAAVRFELFYEQAAPLGPQDGRAVFIDGRWKVSRETRCRIIVQAGVPCP